MTATPETANTPADDSALRRFVSTLTPEEQVLVQDYLTVPDPDTLSDSFDAVVERKTDENQND